ncbi:hypothetical protein [Salinisphaera japonica]|uniref:hypothetical protein n=1 Tax=Salinisphaera japonica TaxID=1304270 RepID=UPI000F4B7B19|nr:hypothetical protein [Salinisphaera japonica]
MTSRLDKYEEFYKFRGHFKERVELLSKRYGIFSDLSSHYNFFIKPFGVVDRIKNSPETKTCSANFGQKPFDEIVTFDHRVGKPSRRLLVENGGTLHYARGDNGAVICFLYPATSENTRPIEDFIILGLFSKASKIHDLRLRLHFKCFVSYMICTSLDFRPTFKDRLLVFALRYVCVTVKDGEMQPRKSSESFRKIAELVVTVGASGWLLHLIT